MNLRAAFLPLLVIPAYAGIQRLFVKQKLESGLHRNDGLFEAFQA